MPTAGATIVYRGVRGFDGRPEVRAFQQRLVAEVAGGRPFDCMVGRDAELRQLNRDFLGHDYPTDVLSFPSGAGAGSLGDIAISVDRAREQAATHGHPVAVEVMILMLHGALHLLGMDHEIDRGRMRRAERAWRARLGLPAGLIERTAR